MGVWGQRMGMPGIGRNQAPRRGQEQVEGRNREAGAAVFKEGGGHAREGEYDRKDVVPAQHQ